MTPGCLENENLENEDQENEDLENENPENEDRRPRKRRPRGGGYRYEAIVQLIMCTAVRMQNNLSRKLFGRL